MPLAHDVGLACLPLSIERIEFLPRGPRRTIFGCRSERPALKRLLEDITAGKVQIVVVYKVDRLTRSLADFAKIVDVLDAHNASFVSVTQQFNTTTSMGRLTLNMLLSFAQFEREIAGERIRADRRLAGGQHFSRGAAEPALSGDIVHQGEAYPGQHEAILDPELWQIVQNKLAVHRQERALGVGAEAPSLLAGLIVDADGSRMTPTHATKKVKRYRYYVSASLLAGDHPQAQKGMRVPAGDIEALVLDRLRALFSSRTDIGDALTPLDLEARAFDAALRNAFTLSKRWLAMPLVEMKSLVLDIVERVTIAANRIDIWLNRAKIAAALEAGGGSQRPDIHPITLSIDAKLRRAGNGKRIVIANGAEAEVNAGLVELIKDAFTIQIQLLSGSDASIEAMSGRLGMNKCRLIPSLVDHDR